MTEEEKERSRRAFVLEVLREELDAYDRAVENGEADEDACPDLPVTMKDVAEGAPTLKGIRDRLSDSIPVGKFEDDGVTFEFVPTRSRRRRKK